MAQEVIEDSLYVDYGELNSNGKTISDKVSVINENIQSIDSLISKNWESWLGKDSDTYVASLKASLKVLSSYTKEMGNIGNFMIEISNDYNEAIENCVGELNSDE